MEAGARLPHYWRTDGTSIFDLLGPEWTLWICAGADAPDATELIEAAEQRDLPLVTISLPDALPDAGFTRGLVLCRPDLFVAWSGDMPPDDAGQVLDHLLGLETR